jgi:hypothetical protein
VLLTGAPADVLLHRLHHPPVHGWGGSHRFVSFKAGPTRRRRCKTAAAPAAGWLPFLDRGVRRPFDQACAARIEVSEMADGASWKHPCSYSVLSLRSWLVASYRVSRNILELDLALRLDASYFIWIRLEKRKIVWLVGCTLRRIVVN